MGIDYHVTNQGSLKDVTVISSDNTKRGLVGVRMWRGTLGPGLLKNVTVDGFSTGMAFEAQQPATVMTLEHIVLRNQLMYGLNETGAHLAARDITSYNTVPAINMQAGGGITRRARR